MNALGGLTIMASTPIAFILSILGLVRGDSRSWALIGLVLSGVPVGLALFSALGCF